jgi:hypothetical protein
VRRQEVPAVRLQSGPAFEHGVEPGEVTDLTPFGIALISISDPDGIQLELTAPL